MTDASKNFTEFLISANYVSTISSSSIDGEFGSISHEEFCNDDNCRTTTDTLPTTYAAPVRSVAALALSSRNMAIIQIFIGSVGIVLNLFTLVVFFLHKSFRSKVTNVLVANLSAQDTVLSILHVLANVFAADPNRILRPGNLNDELLCRLWYTRAPLWCMITSSTYGMVALTFERYLGIVHSMWHKTTFSRRKAKILMSCTWFVGPIFNGVVNGTASGITDTYQCTVLSVWPNPTVRKAVTFTVSSVQYILPLLVLCYFYIRIIVVLRRRPSASSKHETTTSTTAVSGTSTSATAGGGGALSRLRSRLANSFHSGDTVQRAQLNALKMVATVGFFFVLCWSFNSIYFVSGMFNSNINRATDFYNFTVLMVFMLSCINPLVYSVRYHSFQQAVVWLFYRRWLPHQAATGNSSVLSAGSVDDLATSTSFSSLPHHQLPPSSHHHPANKSAPGGGGSKCSSINAVSEQQAKCSVYTITTQ